MSTTLATNMMRSQSQREHLQGLLTEAVTGLCRSSLKYCNKFSVEGLLGITVDDNEVLLISMKETVNSGDITGNDGIKFGGRAIAVAKKRTARVAGLPTFTSADNFHNQRSAADQHSLFTATNSDSNNFSDLQTVIPNDAFESSPPSNKKPCRSPSIGSAGSAPSPSFTPNNPTQEIAFPNMSQVGGNHSSCSTPNPNSQSAPWSPESGTYRLGSISLPGGSGAPLVQDREGIGMRRKSIQKDRHFEHFWEDFEVIYTVCKFASENTTLKLGEMKDALQRTHNVGLDKSTSWFAHHLRKFVFNPLTNRLYLRVDNDGYGRICISEQELLEIISSHHSLHHEGPKKLYETLKEVYYPCNVKRFQDLFQQHVQPACSKCFLNSPSNSQPSNSSTQSHGQWHVLEASRRVSDSINEAVKSIKTDENCSVPTPTTAPQNNTPRPLNMVGRPAGLLGNLSIMQI